MSRRRKSTDTTPFNTLRLKGSLCLGAYILLPTSI
ncbi:MAG: hypothetical protein RLZZ505_2682 [Verrucomicrobiota bacterium]|jgi:hypothetical protein